MSALQEEFMREYLLQDRVLPANQMLIPSIPSASSSTENMTTITQDSIATTPAASAKWSSHLKRKLSWRKTPSTSIDDEYWSEDMLPPSYANMTKASRDNQSWVDLMVPPSYQTKPSVPTKDISVDLLNIGQRRIRRQETPIHTSFLLVIILGFFFHIMFSFFILYTLFSYPHTPFTLFLSFSFFSLLLSKA